MRKCFQKKEPGFLLKSLTTKGVFKLSTILSGRKSKLRVRLAPLSSIKCWINSRRVRKSLARGREKFWLNLTSLEMMILSLRNRHQSWTIFSRMLLIAKRVTTKSYCSGGLVMVRLHFWTTSWMPSKHQRAFRAFKMQGFSTRKIMKMWAAKKWPLKQARLRSTELGSVKRISQSLIHLVLLIVGAQVKTPITSRKFRKRYWKLAVSIAFVSFKTAEKLESLQDLSMAIVLW